VVIQNRDREGAASKSALILGASSGFGEAVGLELANIGYNIYGVHLDRRETLPHAMEVQQKIRDAGRSSSTRTPLTMKSGVR
jgi:NAD(P)-dependent dehydrogenase (short-subunit alcohol dehydrogenase family)